MTEYKEGELVTCTLVTGERALGFYSCSKPNGGSHLIENVLVEGGKKGGYAWASSIDEHFDNSLVFQLEYGK